MTLGSGKSSETPGANAPPYRNFHLLGGPGLGFRGLGFKGFRI